MALAQITNGSVVKLSDINDIIDAVNASGFPSGTKMLFHQAAAPTGWTKQTSVDDSTLRVVSGSTGGSIGGSVAFSTLFATGKTVSLSGNVGATTLTVAQMPSHNHSVCYNQNSSAINTWSLYKMGGTSSGVVYTGNAGGSNSHTHSLSGTATIALNVKYTDVIICSKD